MLYLQEVDLGLPNCYQEMTTREIGTLCVNFHCFKFSYIKISVVGDIPYSSKFLRSINFVIFVRCKLITKI